MFGADVAFMLETIVQSVRDEAKASKKMMTEHPPTPLLDRLENRGVVSFDLRPNGLFLIESYDADADDLFTPEELTELAGELLTLVASIT